MRELEKVLDKGEKVFWEGKPDFWPYFFGSTIVFSLFGFFWWTFLIIPILIAAALVVAGSPWGLGIFLLPHFWVGLAVFPGAHIYIWLVHKHLYYAITNKRVIFQRGLIGRDFDFIDFDQMTNAEVNVGVFDKMFGGSTGSIIISAAGGRSTIPNIKDPYNVFKFFKKISFAVKTDIEFPNLYRPRKNPGYKTGYKPGKV